MSTDSRISLQIEPAFKDLGGFTVARLLPHRQRRRVGPFVFFDQMGPSDFAPGSGVNVRAHPHIGLATITWLFAGEILHRDSLGFVQPIRPGEVNWMTSGRGIVHSEKVTEEVLASGQHLHGLQLWVALPRASEAIEPRFEHYVAEDIPSLRRDGVAIKLIVGDAYGVTSPVRSESRTLYAELKLDAGASIDLPEEQELAVYVVDGDVEVDGTTVAPGHMAVLEAAGATLKSANESHLMLVGGDRLDSDRIVWWNFVASSPELISQAKSDWQNGRFDMVPGETDFIPLPDS